MDTKESALLTLEEAAKHYGIGLRALRRLARLGEIPGAFKVGSRWRIKREKLKEKWGK